MFWLDMLSGFGSIGSVLALWWLFFLMIPLIIIVYWIVSSVFLMKLYAKANVPAWKAWIPYVSSWKFLELGGLPGLWSLLVLTPTVLLILIGIFARMAIFSIGMAGLGTLAVLLWIFIPLCFATGVTLTVVNCMAAYNIGLKLGKGGEWTAIYFFFGIIWLGICGCNSSTWNDSLGRPARGPEIPPGGGDGVVRQPRRNSILDEIPIIYNEMVPSEVQYTVPLSDTSLGSITGLTGSFSGYSIDLPSGEEIIIGKDAKSCSVVIDKAYPEISRKHVGIKYDAAQDLYRIKDYSSNGTWANGVKLSSQVETIQNRGTILKLANEKTTFKLG